MPDSQHVSTRARDDLRADIAGRRPQLVRLRRHFHQHPELAWQEHETSAAIAEHLERLGLDVRAGVAGTGVVGLLHGASAGRTVMVRADIDALPIEEQTEAEYASRTPGRMHACGHDGHIAIALVVAESLAARRDHLHGTIKFVFQPAEEQACGAEPMVRAGVLEDPTVESVIGLHLWSPIPAGQVVVQAGAFFPSADSITLRVRGRGGHGAMPHDNRDPILAAAHIITAAQSLVSREINPLRPAVVTFGMIHGGTAGNIVADEVELGGTVRAFSREDRDHLLARLDELAQQTARGLRAEAELIVGAGCPPVVNDPHIAQLVRRAAVATVGEDGLFPGDGRVTVSDDVAVFLERVPGCYFLVGAGNAARGITAPHHNSRFDIDEEALVVGAEVMARAVLEALTLE